MNLNISNINHPGQLRLLKWLRSNEAKGVLNYYIAKAPRQYGKSFIGLMILLMWAIENKSSKCYWLTKTSDLALLHYKQLIKLIPPEIVKEPGKQPKIIELVNGSTIGFKTTHDPDNVRGFSAHYAVFDEYSYWPAQSADIINKSLISIGKKVLIISTPRGKQNKFYEDWVRGLDDRYPNYFSFTGTNEENPRFSQTLYDQDQLSMPSNAFKAEWLAEFIDDGGEVFPNVEACSTIQTWSEPIAGQTYFAGIDIGRTNDLTVITVIDKDYNTVFIDRFTGIPFLEQVERLSNTLKKYNAQTYIEINIEGTLFELLKRSYGYVYDWRTTHQSKEQLIEETIYNLQTKRVKLPARTLFQHLYIELCKFTYTISKQRNIIYAAPKGEHDDCVISLGLALMARKEKCGNGYVPRLYR